MQFASHLVTLDLVELGESYADIQFGVSIRAVYLRVGWEVWDPGTAVRGSEVLSCGFPSRRAQRAAGRGFWGFRVPGPGSGESRIRGVFEWT